MVDTDGGTDGNITDIGKATNLLDGTTPAGAFTVALDKTSSYASINLGDGGSFTGAATPDQKLPNGLGGTSADNGQAGRDQYALRVTANVTIPAGQYTVAVSSDDGFRLRIPGVTFTARTNENFTGATSPSPADTLVYGGTRIRSARSPW